MYRGGYSFPTMEPRQRHQLTVLRPAFTMIEVLVVLAILGIILAFGAPGYAQQQQRATITKETDRLVSLLREAQSRSLNAEDGLAWQLVCTGSTVTLKTVEDSYATAYDFPKVQCASGTVQFQKLTGLASGANALTLQVHGQAVKRVIISATGTMTTETL